MILEKVISGGQDGVDLAGLDAAVSCGIKTGGVAPKGWKTTHGPDPSLADYGLTECQTEGYAARTKLNIQSSDGTIVLYNDRSSPGTKLTIDFCRKIGKPILLIEIRSNIFDIDLLAEKKYPIVANWFLKNNIKVVNIAGNRKPPWVYDRSYKFLVGVFRYMED